VTAETTETATAPKRRARRAKAAEAPAPAVDAVQEPQPSEPATDQENAEATPEAAVMTDDEVRAAMDYTAHAEHKAIGEAIGDALHAGRITPAQAVALDTLTRDEETAAHVRDVMGTHPHGWDELTHPALLDRTRTLVVARRPHRYDDTVNVHQFEAPVTATVGELASWYVHGAVMWQAPEAQVKAA
jgi:hypothetical protein